MNPSKFFAAIRSCDCVSIIKFDDETKVAQIYNREAESFEAIPEDMVFDVEALTYQSKEESDSFLKSLFGQVGSYKVVSITEDEFKWLLFKMPKGWVSDDFGNFENTHYQVGAKIRLNCSTGKWDLVGNISTESFSEKVAAFKKWEEVVSKDFPYYELHSK